MFTLRRVALTIAILVCLPGAVLAAWAFVDILYSIAAQSWYRDTFLAYGLKLVVLYAFFVCGLTAAGVLAADAAARWGPRMRYAIIAACVAGTIAALLLEMQFWPDGFPPRGMFVGPFVFWAVVAALLRGRRARGPP